MSTAKTARENPGAIVAEPATPRTARGRRKDTNKRTAIKKAKPGSQGMKKASPGIVFERHGHAFAGDPSSLILRMRSGTPARTVPETAGRIGISNERLYEALRLPSSTIKARISKDQALAPAEQDRLYRVERVFGRAVQVLEDEDAARKWINRENRSLGGESPLSLLDTEAGYELVLDTLARIEYGVYA